MGFCLGYGSIFPLLPAPVVLVLVCVAGCLCLRTLSCSFIRLHFGFFGGFLLSTGLGVLHFTVQLLLFWLVLLLLALMGFLCAVVFPAPSLVPMPVCTVSLVDVAMRVLFPAVLVTVSIFMHVVFSLATQVQFPVMPAHAAARVLFRAPALIAPVAFAMAFLDTQVPFPVMPVGILS